MQNANLQKFRLRVYYKKVGRCAWLSHLELIRAIESMIRRSKLQYCVSQGFSPHMKISFCAALSVGIESENQAFDIYLKEYISPEKALNFMKKSSVKQLEIIECKYVDNSEIALNDIYGKINYSVVLDGKVKNIVIPEDIIVFKKKKEKKLKTENYLVGSINISYDKNFTKMNFCLETKAQGSLKPNIFLNQVLECSGCSDLKIIQFKKL